MSSLPPLPLPLSVFNGGRGFSPAAFPHWRAAKAGVMAGVANTRLLMLGDSTYFGANSAGTVNPQNPSYWLSYLFNQAGIPANQNAFTGFSVGASGPGSRAADPQGRISIGSWTANGAATLGGPTISSSATGTPFVFAPTAAWDTINIFYHQVAGGGVATLTATGGTAVTVNSGASPGVFGVATAVAATGSASNTATLNFVSGSGFFIIGFEAFLSTQKTVNIFNCGWWGATASAMSSAGSTAYDYSPLNVIASLKPSLVLFSSGINESKPNNAAGSFASFSSDVQNIITAAVNAGADVAMQTGIPSANAGGNGNLPDPGQELLLVPQLLALGVANNIPVSDVNTRFGPYPTGHLILPAKYTDTIHPSGVGCYDMIRPTAHMLVTT